MKQINKVALIFCYHACKYLLIKIFTDKIQKLYELYKKFKSFNRMQISEKPIIIGVLLDVSGSMRENTSIDDINSKITWDESIFKILEQFLKDNVSANKKDRFFTIGFGGNENPLINILSTLQKIDLLNTIKNCYPQTQYYQIIKKFHDIVKPNARYIQQYAPQHLIKKVIPSIDEVRQLFYILEHDQQIFNKFISLLPKFVKYLNPIYLQTAENVSQTVYRGLIMIPFWIRAIQNNNFAIQNNNFAIQNNNLAIQNNNLAQRRAVRQGKKQQIEKIYLQIKQIIKNKYESDLTIYQQKEYQFGIAYNILKNTSDRNNYKQLSQDQIKELLKKIQPYIYGNTPFFKAINRAINQFKKKDKSYHKILFIISDGSPTDQGNIKKIKQQLDNQQITVICCYINKNKNVDSLRIYCKQDNSWQPGAKLMFNLSSTFKTQKIPRYIFTRPNWKVDCQYNQSKLFVHANNPKNIEEICKLANQLIYSQEALSEIVSQVSLDVYINQQRDSMISQKQKYRTCYAYATSSVIHMALRRIRKRNQSDYLTLKNIRESIISHYGRNGADTSKVLSERCPKYNLRYREIDINQAKQAIIHKRPVIATFYLTNNDEWPIFSKFYKQTPKQILSKKVLDISKRNKNQKLDLAGHAVVLVSYDQKSLKFMNSWGTQWADGGFFKIADTNVLNLKYYDVFWYQSDLTKDEQNYFKQQNKNRVQMIILSTLRQKKYTCPLCKQQQKLTQFTGTLEKTICPKCKKTFQVEKNEKLQRWPLDYKQLSLCLYLNSLNS